MNNPIIRLIVAVIVGVVAGGLMVFLVESIGHMIYPPPADLNLADPASRATMIERLAPGALAMVVIGWFLGSLAGALIANRIARQARAGWIVALLFIALTAFNFTVIPHPAWMIAAGIALPLLAAWIAARTVRAVGA